MTAFGSKTMVVDFGQTIDKDAAKVEKLKQQTHDVTQYVVIVEVCQKSIPKRFPSSSSVSLNRTNELKSKSEENSDQGIMSEFKVQI